MTLHFDVIANSNGLRVVVRDPDGDAVTAYNTICTTEGVDYAVKLIRNSLLYELARADLEADEYATH